MGKWGFVAGNTERQTSADAAATSAAASVGSATSNTTTSTASTTAPVCYASSCLCEWSEVLQVSGGGYVVTVY